MIFQSRRMLILLAVCLQGASAFLVPSPTTVTTRTSSLQVTYNDMEDLQKKRGEFEELMKDQSLMTPKQQNQPSFPIMTTAGRRRRELEIDLLTSMKESDDGVDELMHLWLYEHTVDEAMMLESMEDQCSPGLVEEQRTLKRMIQENPHWAEPRVRLATLLFFKGETQESHHVAIEAMNIKPWHFEIYQLLVMLALRQRDMGQALFWARSGLPQLRQNSKSNNRKRKEWVERHIKLAHEQWQQAEQATEDYMNSLKEAAPVSEEDSMWQ